MSRQLFRSRDDRMLAGVAGGLAELWDADSSVVRIIWVILVPFTGGFALLAYVIMALVVPEEDDEPAVSAHAAAASSSSPGSQPADDGSDPTVPVATPIAATLAPTESRSARREARAARRAARRAGRRGPGSAGLLIGALLVIAGVYFLVREYVPDIDVSWLWPVALIALGVVVLMSAFRRPPADSSGPDAPR